MAWSCAEAGSPRAFSRSQYHSAYSPLGAKAGTEYTPQWMKMPNLASLHQPGVGRLSTELHRGSTPCPCTAVAARHRHIQRRQRGDIAATSIAVEHFGHGRPPLV